MYGDNVTTLDDPLPARAHTYTLRHGTTKQTHEDENKPFFLFAISVLTRHLFTFHTHICSTESALEAFTVEWDGDGRVGHLRGRLRRAVHEELGRGGETTWVRGCKPQGMQFDFLDVIIVTKIANYISASN